MARNRNSREGLPYTDVHDPLRRTAVNKLDVRTIALFAGLEVGKIETIMRLTVLALEAHERKGTAKKDRP